MMYRNIKYLTDCIEFQSLVSKYNLKFKIVKDEKLILISKCLIFEIYALVPETFFYFDIYSIAFDCYTNIDRLLSDISTEKISSIYREKAFYNKNILCTKLQGNKVNTLKAEQHFFIMLQLMDEFLSNIILCKESINKQLCTEVFENKRRELLNIISLE